MGESEGGEVTKTNAKPTDAGALADGGRADAYAGWARSGADYSFAPTLGCLLELLPTPPLDILDVGCGEGRIGHELVERGFSVVGVDSDQRMVQLASEKHEAVAALATALPFAAASFACVITVHALMEIEDLEGAVAEMARVLEPGGVAIAIVEHPFASAAKVSRYSESARYSWAVSHQGVNVGLGGIHRPLRAYVASVEKAGLTLETVREISVGRWDPMSLAISAQLPSGA
jgi:SAM-dependent methyltransferase